MSQPKQPTLDPVVRASYQELIRFLRFYRHHGTPVVIGGWAVYFYNPYYGSVDIDVIGASLKGAFEEIIEKYEITHGYEFVRDAFGIESVASKPIFRGRKKIGDMEIDACSYERADASRFHENHSKILPYSLCDRKGYRREVRLSKDSVCYVPGRALLTLFKAKARRDRSYDIRERGATMNPERLAWLQGKVVKDGSDLVALLDPKPRRTALHESMGYGQLKMIAKIDGGSTFYYHTDQLGSTRLVTDSKAKVLFTRIDFATTAKLLSIIFLAIVYTHHRKPPAEH